MPLWGTMASRWLTITSGIAPFFKPNPVDPPGRSLGIDAMARLRLSRHERFAARLSWVT